MKFHFFFLLCRWSFGRLTLVRAAFFMFTCIIFISQCISSRCLLKCVSEFQNCFITELVRVISPKCCSHPACACLICTQIARKKKLLSIFYVKQDFFFCLFCFLNKLPKPHRTKPVCTKCWIQRAQLTFWASSVSQSTA